MDGGAKLILPIAVLHCRWMLAYVTKKKRREILRKVFHYVVSNELAESFGLVFFLLYISSLFSSHPFHWKEKIRRARRELSKVIYFIWFDIKRREGGGCPAAAASFYTFAPHRSGGKLSGIRAASARLDVFLFFFFFLVHIAPSSSSASFPQDAALCNRAGRLVTFSGPVSRRAVALRPLIFQVLPVAS